MTRFPVLERHFPVLEYPFLLQNILFCFRTSFSCFRTSFSALSHFVPLDRAGQALKILYRLVLRPIPRPVLDFDRLSRPVPALGKILSLFHCPFVLGQGRNFCPFVPKSLIHIYYLGQSYAAIGIANQLTNHSW